jgi:membrane protein
MTNPAAPVIAWLDDRQRRRKWLGFPLAVLKKFGDDEAGKQAALIAYFGFFSLFPLMLVLVTVLGFLLGKSSHLESQVVHSVLSRFPIIGDQIRGNVHSLRGSGFALAVGIAGSLWGGMGVIQAGQGAMDTVWHVPRKSRPSFLKSRLRALLLLLVLGAGVITSTFLTGVATAGTGQSLVVKAAVLLASTVLNVGLFLLAFRLLTVARVAWRDLFPGAAVAAVAWEILQALGGYYLGHTLKGASQTYGFFGIVIGLLSWIYLQAQVTLLAAEINVVRAWQLWPRSLVADRPTEADKRVLTGLAKTEEITSDEQVDVTFRKVS